MVCLTGFMSIPKTSKSTRKAHLTQGGLITVTHRGGTLLAAAGLLGRATQPVAAARGSCGTCDGRQPPQATLSEPEAQHGGKLVAQIDNSKITAILPSLA